MVCHGEQEAFIILRHTVEMLKDLHKKIVVEGVETQEMVDILQKCTAIICRVTCILNRFRKVIILHFCKDIYDYQIKTPTICIK